MIDLDETRIINDLERTQAAAWVGLRHQSESHEYVRYATKLHYELDRYKEHTSLDVQKALAKFYAPSVYVAVVISSVPVAHKEDLASFLEVVTKHKLAKYLLSEPEYAELFAGAAVFAALVSEQADKNFQALCHALVEQLTGKTIPFEHTVTQEEMTGLLYGKAAWGLYAQEVESSFLISQHLIKNKVPLLRGIIGNVDEQITSLPAPQDFYSQS